MFLLWLFFDLFVYFFWICKAPWAKDMRVNSKYDYHIIIIITIITTIIIFIFIIIVIIIKAS